MGGLSHTLFQPLTRFPADSIAPTELDNTFRQQLLRGDVHDQGGAAMLGGISGHAGLFFLPPVKRLFFNAIFFMDGGTFNESQYLNPETIKHFATARYKDDDNRRGIGFDMPPVDPDYKYRTPGKSASDESFGHTGFTGTFAWADPEHELVVVFFI